MSDEKPIEEEGKPLLSIDEILAIPDDEDGLDDAAAYDPEASVTTKPAKTKDDDSFTSLISKQVEGIGDFLQEVPDLLKNLPPAIRRAYLGKQLNPETGEEEDKPLAYDFPEITDAPIDFWQGFSEANIRALLTSDSLEKRKLLDKLYADNPRYGTKQHPLAVRDEYGNIIVHWDSKPYYLNKPGFSEIDLDSLFAQAAYFALGERFKNKHDSKALKLGKTALSIAALETGRQLLTKDELDYPEGAITTAVGVGTEAVAGPFGRFSKIIADRVRRNAEEVAGIPLYSITAPAEKQLALIDSPKPDTTLAITPKTRGQTIAARDATKVAELDREDLIRNSQQFGKEAQELLKEFDAEQLQVIKNNVDLLLDNIGAGKIRAGEGSLVDIGELVLKEIQKTANRLKTKATGAYGAAKDAGPAFIVPESIVDLAQKLKRDASVFIDNAGRRVTIGPLQLQKMPMVVEHRAYLDRIIKIFSNPRARSVNYELLRDFEVRLNMDIRSAAAGSPEELVLNQIKTAFDDGVHELIENTLILGDETAVKNLKEANRLWAKYKAFQMGPKGSPALNQMPKIVAGNKSALEVVNIILGSANKVLDKGLGKDIINRIIKVEGKDGPTIQLLKNAILLRTFSMPRTNVAGEVITRAKIVNNFKDNFIKNKEITKLIFDEKEIQGLRKFVDDVEITMPAEQWKNTSGTSYTAITALANSGIIKSLMFKLPWIGDISRAVGSAAESAVGGSAAKRAIEAGFDPKKFLTDISTSLIKAVPPAAVPESDIELGEQSSLNKIIQQLKPPAIEKLQSIT